MDGEINAKAKYLKYKAKYEELKQKLEAQQGGLGRSGWYTIITSAHLANQLNLQEKFKPGNPAPSLTDIQKLLDKMALSVKSFSNKVEVIMPESALAGRLSTSLSSTVDRKGLVDEPKASLSHSNMKEEYVKAINDCIAKYLKEQKNETYKINQGKLAEYNARQQTLQDANFFNVNNTINLPFNYLAANEKAWLQLSTDEQNKTRTSSLKAVRDAIVGEANKLLFNRIKQNIANAVPSRTVNDISLNYFITINMSAFGKNMVKEVGNIE
jgi:hypothetical protein